MLYLASPYTHPHYAIRRARYKAACRVAAKLIQRGHVIFSPIAHSHGIAKYGLPTNWDFWETQDRWFLQACDAVVILTLDGWQESRGIAGEIAIAKELGKPIRYLSP